MIMNLESFSLEHYLAVSLVSILQKSLNARFVYDRNGMDTSMFCGAWAVALGRLGAFQSRRINKPSSYRFRISVIFLLIQGHEKYSLDIDPIIRFYHSRRRAPRTTINCIPPSHLVILQCRQIHRRSYLFPYKYQDHPFLAWYPALQLHISLPHYSYQDGCR